jgi:hypothetical protein
MTDDIPNPSREVGWEELERLTTENAAHKKAHDHFENELLVLSHRIMTLVLQLKSVKADPTKLFRGATGETQGTS